MGFLARTPFLPSPICGGAPKIWWLLAHRPFDVGSYAERGEGSKEKRPFPRAKSKAHGPWLMTDACTDKDQEQAASFVRSTKSKIAHLLLSLLAEREGSICSVACHDFMSFFPYIYALLAELTPLYRSMYLPVYYCAYRISFAASH